MSLHVYLFKNGDLYNIGYTSNLENAKKILQPAVLVASIKTDKAALISSQLQVLFKEVQLPSSDYFRLSRTQALDCKKQLENIGGKDYFQPFFTGPRLLLGFIIAWIFITYIIINFGVEPILSRFT
tara:strand:+ start:913 stop:1290 length:378 start_codon:yes stop_codon:yes gene_type:complete